MQNFAHGDEVEVHFKGTVSEQSNGNLIVRDEHGFSNKLYLALSGSNSSNVELVKPSMPTVKAGDVWQSDRSGAVYVAVKENGKLIFRDVIMGWTADVDEYFSRLNPDHEITKLFSL